MSNCIDIYNPVLEFPPQRIVLGPLLTRVEDLKEAPKDVDLSIAWWFLSNTTIDVDGRTTINLGFGRSIHTYRDFRATMLCLCRHMIPGKSVTKTLIIRDAENPGSPWERYKVVFRREGG
jgi:hypothetical protein